MKTSMKRMLKKLTAIGAAMILALLFCVCLSISAFADAQEPAVVINAVSLRPEDRIALLYRVQVTGAYGDYDVSMQFGTEAPDGEDWTFTTAEPYRTQGENLYFFSYGEQTPQEMVDSVYCRAVLDLGDDVVYSDFLRYSVLDYAHDTRNSTYVMTEGGSTLGEIVQSILEYGAALQSYSGYKTDRLATDDYYLVRAENGTFADGMKTAIVFGGESPILTAKASSRWQQFDHWEDENGGFLSYDETIALDPTSDSIYRAVFTEIEHEENVSLDLLYEDIDDTTCALAGMGICTDTDLVIPNRAPDGKLVTKINADALAGNTDLVSIRIPKSLTTVEPYAFESCTSLEAFIVEEGSTSFMTDREMLLTYDGTTILRYPPAREGNAILLPDTVTELADGSFADAMSLATVTMNDVIERIGDYAFARSALSSVKIKATVTEIGDYAFDHCSKLTSVSVESANPYYKATTYGIYNKDSSRLIRARNQSGVITLATTIKSIAPGALSGCDKITTVTIPTNTKTIGEYAFADCTALKTLTIGKNVETIGAYAFYGCNNSSFTSVTIPANVNTVGDSAFENCTYLATVTLNGEPENVGERVLRGTAVSYNPFGHEHDYTIYTKVSDANCAHATLYGYACECGELGEERIVSGTSTAHNYFSGYCSVCGQVQVSTSYDSYLILPTTVGSYYGNFDPSDSSYSSIDDCNIIYFESFTSADFTNYLKKLRNAGLTEVENYTLGNNRYALFRRSGSYTLYASYLNTEQALRVYVGKANDVYPSKAQVADANLVTPSIWQININNKAASSNGGMSYVIQLTDGKFIVVDGGYETAEDAKSIYNILKANKPASHSKPIVAGWFLTHMHIDHVGAFRKFADTYSYRTGVTIEAFYYNFSYTTVDDIYPSNSNTWETKMSSSFPSATRYRKLHSGMNFYFSGAEVKILCTHEDVYPFSFNSGNDTSMVFQVIIGGQKILFLGDAEFKESDRMVNLGSSVMKSDILQYAHHGYENQCRTNLYQLILPTTVLWPMPIVSYQNTSYSQCFYPRYSTHSENSWVRNATCVKKIIVMEEAYQTGYTRLMLPYTPTGARNADYTTIYNNIKKTLK